MTTLEEQLGFDKIKQLVVDACTNKLAARMATQMTFETRFDRIKRELGLVDEFRTLTLFGEDFPTQDFYDLTDELNRLRIGNTVIELQAMIDLKASLHTITSCLHCLSASEESDFRLLKELASHVNLNPTIVRSVDKIIDDKGEIVDSASKELLAIRSAMRSKRGEVDAQLQRCLAKAKREGWSPEQAEVTIRNGRRVIPMIDTHRRKIKGLIHDESASRQTAYLEPSEVVELNNDLRELEFAERHEINKILLAFSDSLRPQLNDLVNAYWFLGKLDFLRAKVSVGEMFQAVVPLVEASTHVDWHEARHPLLILSAMQRANGSAHASLSHVVPFDMELNESCRIIIISGPNAGGKSVCLKAVGLLQYMLQAGMPVPCKETSVCGVFSNLFIDIGDSQSIENDLSTYSSHLNNMKLLLETADPATLFLIDELGGGTEPRSGCAIAEALLEELDNRGSFGVVTTHFADLKLLADKHKAMKNAAMLYDTDLMQPLYKLSVGHPGSSFAFEIASKIGLPRKVLDAAESKVGKAMLNFEHQLQQLELDKQRVAEQQRNLEAADAVLDEVVRKYQKLTADIEQKKNQTLAQARSQAKEIIAGANRAVERTIAEIKESQAERQRTKEARQQLASELHKLEEELAQPSIPTHVAHHTKVRNAKDKPQNQPAQTLDDTIGGDIAIGDVVKIDNDDTFAQVVELKGKKAIVESNALRMTIALSRLTKTSKKVLPAPASTRRNSSYGSVFDNINEKRMSFNPTLDLRGHRAEEALIELQQFIDEAKLLGEHEVRILHGKGYGILKTLVREQLNATEGVASYKAEKSELGGEGITVVQLI